MTKNDDEDRDNVPEQDEQVGPIDDAVVHEVRLMNEEWEKAKKTGQQLGLGLEPDDLADEDPDAFDGLADVQNPGESYNSNYAIRRELMNNLPTGREYKKMRDFIYEEKNIYLRAGKKKRDAVNGVIGADSRITNTSRQRVILDLVRKWSAAGGTPVDIFFAFVELNQQAGFRPKAQA